MKKIKTIEEQMQDLEKTYEKFIKNIPKELSDREVEQYIENKSKWHRWRFRNLQKKLLTNK